MGGIPSNPNMATPAGCSTCAGSGQEACSLELERGHELPESGPMPRWWRQPRWQLRAAGYALLAFGLVAEFLLHQEAAAIVLYAASVITGAYPSARDAWRSLKRFQLSIAALVIVGALGAILLDLWEEAAALVAVYSLGGIFEARVLDRAQEAVRDIRDLAPHTALLVREDGDAETPIERVGVGDIIRIRPGMRVPLDGIVVEGHSAMDESSVSGEPLPVDKGPGDLVLSGTLSRYGSLTVRVTSTAEDSTIVEVIRAVEEARKNKSSLETFGERFGAVYTPAMFVLALSVAGIPTLLGLSWAFGFYRALVVLVISCSCGLLLSVPVATLSAVTTGARRGLVIKGGAYLEAASEINVVVLDKTGTLTLGRPHVLAVHGFGGHSPDEALALAAAVEAGSEHPLATAVRNAACETGLGSEAGLDFEANPGRGARATVRGHPVFVGGVRWAREAGVDLAALESARDLGGTGTLLLLWDSSGLIGGILVGDTLRPQAQVALAQLRELGIRRFVMMTGDAFPSAEGVARPLGEIEVMAGLLPAEKAAEIRRLQSEGCRVAFVGDGINDAPALAQADLGIAMGLHGTDIARATCDVVLVDDDLRRLPEVFSFGRRAMQVMRENVALSIIGVAILVSLALAGVVGLVAAIALNEGSALAVTANGLRLGRSRSTASLPSTQSGRGESVQIATTSGDSVSTIDGED